MIFKGYTIVYEVDFKNNKIFVFHIFNQNLPVNIEKNISLISERIKTKYYIIKN
jgi:hypothetical protein